MGCAKMHHHQGSIGGWRLSAHPLPLVESPLHRCETWIPIELKWIKQQLQTIEEGVQQQSKHQTMLFKQRRANCYIQKTCHEMQTFFGTHPSFVFMNACSKSLTVAETGSKPTFLTKARLSASNTLLSPQQRLQISSKLPPSDSGQGSCSSVPCLTS